MRIDIMVDIETLGTRQDATIFQVAAVAFDILTGETIETFNQIADIGNASNLRVDGSTIKWWLNTNKDLLTELLNNGTVSTDELLKHFNKWLVKFKDGAENIYLWGNGILFDNKMIQYQFEQLGLEYPIYYRNDRDVRTIVDLASVKLGISEAELKERYNDESLTKHNAFDDVMYQIRLVKGCYEVLIH